MSAVKDVLLKLQFSLVNYRAQCNDGPTNMMRHKTGVAKRTQDLQPKAYPHIKLCLLLRFEFSVAQNYSRVKSDSVGTQLMMTFLLPTGDELVHGCYTSRVLVSVSRSNSDSPNRILLFFQKVVTSRL